MIKDTKFKVNSIDLNNVYEVFSQKFGHFNGIYDNEFDNVKKIDEKINSLDKKLAIKLNKFHSYKGINI